MRRLIALFFSIFILVGGVMAQQMSDDQVVQYVKEAQRTGKSQKQMTTELLRRGVTKEQVARIQKNMPSIVLLQMEWKTNPLNFVNVLL